MDDDRGQVDGESPFAMSMHSSPWVQSSGMSPWHMWGNTQTLTTPVEGVFNPRIRLQSNQLIKISYKRPETWHWWLACRLIDGPDAVQVPAASITLNVFWDLTIGLGRSMFQTADGSDQVTSRPAFDHFRFVWGPAAATFPRGARTWQTQAYAPQRFVDLNVPAAFLPPFQNNEVPPTGNLQPLNQIVAQDIQLDVRAIAVVSPPGPLTTGPGVTFEVSAFFAPKVHVRPDWLRLDVPPEAQFTGEEIGGR